MVTPLLFSAIIGVIITVLSGTSYYASQFITSLRFIVAAILLGEFSGLIYGWFSNINNYVQATINIGAGNVFELTTVGAVFSLLTICIILITIIAGWYLAVNQSLFFGLLMFIALCLMGAFLSTNIFVFLIFFELSALPVFILIGYCGSARRERLKANYYFLFFTLYGSMSLLIVLLSAYSLLAVSFISNLNISILAYILLFISFAIKIPLFPFHIWLPYAHVEASTISSIILAALLLKLGGYGLIQFLVPGFDLDTNLYYRPIILFLCLIGFIYGSLCAIRQIDLKRQIAFSSIAHMSFAIFGAYAVSTVGTSGAIFLMFSHGLISSALFFLVGTLSDRYHTRAITAFSGLMGVMPLFSGFLIISILANIGFPGTSGFIPELIILISVISSLPTIAVLVLFGMVITAVSNLVIPLRILFGHPRVLISNTNLIDLTFLEFTILALLTLLIIGFGFFTYGSIIIPNYI